LRIDTHRVVWLMASLVFKNRIFQCAEDNAFDLIVLENRCSDVDAFTFVVNFSL
jgi:hypothetical protein